MFPVTVCHRLLILLNGTPSAGARASPASDQEAATLAMHDATDQDAACQGLQPPSCLPSQQLGLVGAEAGLGPSPALDGLGQQGAPRWPTRETEEQDRFAVYHMKVIQLAPPCN